MSATARKSDSVTRRFPDRVAVRVQPEINRAIDQATAKQFTTPAEYVRRCLVDRLRADGFDPAAFAA